MAGTNVTVNAVLPGPTRSKGVVEFLAAMAKDSDQPADVIEKEFIAQNRPSSILGRFATPEEVANMVVYVSPSRHPPPRVPRCASTAV
jgi:NAD(P)-dependent dehydrogenase (short-subunit alcohol dehydrogenase family)